MTDQHKPLTIGESAEFDADDPNLTRFDLVKEGARRDGVEIVHYEPRFPVPGTKAEKRVERTIALMLALTGLASVGFVVVYVAWPYEYEQGTNLGKFYTPMLGITMGLALFGIGAAVILWAKKLLPDEVAVQDRHDGASPRDERVITGAAILNMVDETGIKRRPLLKGALAAGLLPAGALAVVPLGGLIEDPGDKLYTTGWAEGVRLVREDGTPVRPDDVTPGGLETVFPGIEHGTTNEYADSPTLLVNLDPEAAKQVRPRKGFEDANYGNLYAYSKICTHAGCPASLFESQSKVLLCPCHQSQFNVLDGAKPVFGPAARSLPQLPITVDDDGYLVARSDYLEPIGPSFWERGE